MRVFLGCSSLSRAGNVPGGVTRREMLVQFGAAGFGLTLPALLQRPVAAGAPARSCIFLFLNGGASQYETFDPRPDAPIDIRGTFKPIRTRVPGMDLCELMPELASRAHRFSLIRSMTHTDSGHPSGSYWMMTGFPYPRSPSLSASMSRLDRPHHGAVLARLRPSASRAIPSFVTVPEQMHPVGPIRAGQHAGFLGAGFDPFVMEGDPNSPGFTPGELRLTDRVNSDRLIRRQALLSQQNLRFRLAPDGETETGLQPHYAGAFDLLTGRAAARAFDLSREPAATRDRYGRHIFGQSTLLARRLIEAGTRFVAVNWVRHDDGPGGQGWDTHSTHLPWCKDELVPPTDRAVAALLDDLSDRGMLDETLVVVTGEFGRTPRFNANGGRDHWPNVFSTLLAGGGIRPGLVHGASTPDGSAVAEDPVSPGDLAATLYHCLGISPNTELHDQESRPMPLTSGRVLTELL